MDNCTKDVTLAAAFISDILTLYNGKSDQAALKLMAAKYDLSNPMNQVPIQVYNDMCQWVESEIGEANTRLIGKKIGETAYQSMAAQKMISENPTPIEAMEALVKVASIMIQDPKNRGWEIAETDSKHIIMRRTQTFNSTLQLGLLEGLIRKTKVFSPQVSYLKQVSEGDEFDEYKIAWL